MVKHLLSTTARSFQPFLVVAALLFAIILSSFIASHTVGAFDAGITEGAASARGDEQPTDLFGLSGTFTTITNVLLFVVGAVSVIMIIIGGLRYVLSGGDSANVTAAKNTILYAVIGIIVALLAYALVNFVVGSFADGSAGGGLGGSSTSGGSATSF